MSSSRLRPCSARATPTLRICLSCQSRQFTQISHLNGIPKLASYSHQRIPGVQFQSRDYATKQRFDGPKARADVDERSRLGFYTLTKQQGFLKMEPRTAQSIYQDFVANKGKMDHGENVLRLVKKYNVKLEDVASLGIITFRIPDVTDPVKRAQLPPSQHKPIAGLILQGCAKAEDPLAIVQILTAVYLSGTGYESARELARLFASHEIQMYRKALQNFNQETLAKDTALGPEVLTLEGLFLEQDGQRLKAKEAYLKAITPSSLKYDPGSRHPMQLPMIAPWNALGFLLKADNDPKIQAEAKIYFERGALEGDDPLSYYELAAFEPRTSEKWLRYTSKAAASGHEQAIIDLTEFYEEAAKTDSPLLEHGSVRKALNWLLTWRPGSAAAMAREWLQAASDMGHKPSMLRLADYYDSVGEDERAKDYLRQIVEAANETNQREKWPQLVQLARKRLAGIK